MGTREIREQIIGFVRDDQQRMISMIRNDQMPALHPAVMQHQMHFEIAKSMLHLADIIDNIERSKRDRKEWAERCAARDAFIEAMSAKTKEGEE